MPNVGDLISGKYRLARIIGDGGMGTVFEAQHEYLGTQVALKFLHPELVERQGLVARFLQEARLAATLKSPYVAQVTDVDQTSEGMAYLVMELLRGQSLQKTLERERKVPPDRALDYTMQMLAGLEAAHAIGVVHRDLKPDNIFVVDTPHGPLVKLLDFGIAKLKNPKEWQAGLTRPGSMMGTPEYMAPEQAYSADTVDARADVYAVGTILYEMLAGRRPAVGENAQQIASFVIAGQVVNLHQLEPSLPEGLTRIVHRAMSPMPKDRFASVVELRQALLPFCRSLSVAGRFAATPPAGAAPPPGIAPTLPPAEPSSASTTEPGTPAPSPAYAPPAPAYAPPAPAHPAPTPGYGASTPNRHDDGFRPAGRTRPPRRASLWLLLGTIGLAIGIVAIVIVTSQATSDDSTSQNPTATATAIGPAPTASAATPAPASPPRDQPVVIAPPVQPTNAPAPARPATPAAKPRPADAGPVEAGQNAPAAPPAGLPFPFPSVFPLPLPSGLPPLPSAFPIPSGFPPFSLPGFPPAVPAPGPSR